MLNITYLQRKGLSFLVFLVKKNCSNLCCVSYLQQLDLNCIHFVLFALDIHKTLFEEICLFAPYAVIKCTSGIDLIRTRQVKKIFVSVEDMFRNNQKSCRQSKICTFIKLKYIRAKNHRILSFFFQSIICNVTTYHVKYKINHRYFVKNFDSKIFYLANVMLFCRSHFLFSRSF
jgi:hypothetical protein